MYNVYIWKEQSIESIYTEKIYRQSIYIDNIENEHQQKYFIKTGNHNMYLNRYYFKT